MKQDVLFKDRVNIYDTKGNKRGVLKKDSLSEDRTNIYLDGWD